MSFLNPISEPVLMYSSTDANAPQINQNARAAGDVKTVLKACLVTGYGSKQGAGWTIQNETATVAEFVSPSILLSDYRFGIDDSSTTATTFYYTYQGTRVNPSYNAPTKSMSYTNKTSAKNTWTMLVTKQGFLWIEKLEHDTTKLEMCRIMYWGRIKSALIDDMGKNIAYYTMGFNSPIASSSNFFTNEYQHIRVENFIDSVKNGANVPLFKNPVVIGKVAIELTNSIFFSSSSILLGELAPLLMTKTPDKSKIFGLYNVTFNGRPALYICIGLAASGATQAYLEQYCGGCYVYLDNWDY